MIQDTVLDERVSWGETNIYTLLRKAKLVVKHDNPSKKKPQKTNIASIFDSL